MGSPGMEEERDPPQRSIQAPQDAPVRRRSTSTERSQSSDSNGDTGEVHVPRPELNRQLSERRGSVPTGLVEHHVNVQTNMLCGQILRVMGDEHYSKGLGKHLRYMGDEMCYSYLLRNNYISSTQRRCSHLSNSHSLPDLSRH